MAAKTSAQRMREKRARDKLTEEERQARHVSRKIVTELYRATDMALIRVMARVAISEDQDIITQLIHAADGLTTEALRKHIGIA
ncbi:hypothetical protein [Pseudomonas petrae]|uniref:hypothetical protein n=1 Tax=Pseudomonas petrae TaxID=2912190 RepID=UPI001F27D32E|nr:hypothetical protein [Pseudomonas petrae]MCF7536204.1 hypothetical protein [Pseudomonas petrae]